MSKRDVLQVCVIGTGNQGKAHAASVQAHPYARVACVIGELVFQKQVEEFIAEYGDENTKAFYSFEEGLKTKIDLMIIASPDPTHHPFVLAALNAGIKEIFCEKPLGVGIAQIREISDKVASLTKESPKNPPRVVCGFQRRYDVDFIAIKEALEKDTIGRPELLRIIARDPIHPSDPYKPVPSTQTVVYNSMSHDIDMARWLLGEEPSQVYATRQSGQAVDGVRDNIVALLKFPSGIVCTIEWTKGITYGYVQAVEVHGTKGMVRTNDVPISRVVTCKAQTHGWETAPTQPFFPQRYKETYRVEVTHVIDAALDRRYGDGKILPKVELEDCLKVAQIADQIVDAVAASQKITESKSGDFVEVEIPTFPPLTQKPWTPLKDKTLRIALVGAGRMGSIRANLIAKHQRAELAYVIDLRAEMAETLAQKYGGKGATDLAKVLKEDPSVNAVWIAVGTQVHFKIITIAAAAGKAIFCEKPIALDKQEIYNCFKATAEAGVPLMVGWNRRFDPHFKRLHEKSNTDSFGPPRVINTVCGDNPLPPTNILIALGSIYHDLMVHDIDIAFWFTRELPQTVYALGHSFIDGLGEAGVLDTAALVMTYPDKGCTALLVARRQSTHGYDQRLEVVGGHGKAILADNPSRSTVVLREEGGDLHDTLSYTFEDRYEESYLAEIDNFVNVVLGDSSGKAAPASSFEESLSVAVLTDASLASQNAGKVVLLKQPQSGTKRKRAD
eukprot:TRINITY_DN2944_c0_g1_i1.p1 TRINITY_DN2944_c0_g1~~TRINITY_DN2944_c0_g1_i1.p1  ORF type:complete len:729 (+),score=118.86 TRINITY_DN2944_c0_g1_i1:1465-3651(+)